LGEDGVAEFVIHGLPFSPYVRAVRMMIAEKGAEARVELPAGGGIKSAEHRQLHPFGRMPAFEHKDFRLYETQAILRYLDRILPDPPMTPADPRLEARMNQICGVLDHYVFPDIGGGICFGRLVAPKFGMPTDEAKIAESIPKARICLAELANLLGDQPFMAGSTISIADILLAPHLAFLSMTPEGPPLLAEQPELAAWLNRMMARPCMQNS
jgi:glutathione S-transferase